VKNNNEEKRQMAITQHIKIKQRRQMKRRRLCAYDKVIMNCESLEIT